MSKTVARTCVVSGESFLVDERDQEFYSKIQVPFPTLAPKERQRRRAAWRNELNFHHRSCDLTGKKLISIYPAATAFPVYSSDAWWGDEWDALDYGMAFDISKSFLDQLAELRRRVPRLTLYQKNAENSPYTNHVDGLKDCHLCIDTGRSRNIYYSKWAIDSRDCIDCYRIHDSELCFECQYQRGGYNNIFAYYCEGCRDSAFLYRCRAVADCFMCDNLSHQRFCIRNQQVGEEAYKRFISAINLGSHSQLEELKKEFFARLSKLRWENYQVNCEDSEGNFLLNCKNVTDSTEIDSGWDCRYCYESSDLRDCYDTFESGFQCELQYDCHACNRAKCSKWCHVCYDIMDCDYCDSCHNSSDLFGCIGVRHKQYCILNKQYTKGEYLKLRSHIIKQMSDSREWGEFFPIAHSPFPYNSSYAQEVFPLSKSQVLKRGYRWEEGTIEEASYSFSELPDDIHTGTDALTANTYRCAVSKKPFKLIAQEIDLLKQIGVALPRNAPAQRYIDRLAWRTYVIGSKI